MFSMMFRNVLGSLQNSETQGGAQTPGACPRACHAPPRASQVEFHALRFVEPIRRVAQRLVDRISEGGTRPYVALHLRLEKDVWVRTGCSPGLGPDLDAMVRSERERRPDLLTGRVNLTADARRQAGLCPMTAGMVAR